MSDSSESALDSQPIVGEFIALLRNLEEVSCDRSRVLDLLIQTLSDDNFVGRTDFIRAWKAAHSDLVISLGLSEPRETISSRIMKLERFNFRSMAILKYVQEMNDDAFNTVTHLNTVFKFICANSSDFKTIAEKYHTPSKTAWVEAKEFALVIRLFLQFIKVMDKNYKTSDWTEDDPWSQ